MSDILLELTPCLFAVVHYLDLIDLSLQFRIVWLLLRKEGFSFLSVTISLNVTYEGLLYHMKDL